MQMHLQGQVAIVSSASCLIHTPQDALDLLAEASLKGADALILRRHHLTGDFYRLRTGLAGDVLQKFTNYGMRVAILGDFTDLPSPSLRDFILECNRGTRVLFLKDLDTALARLGAKGA